MQANETQENETQENETQESERIRAATTLQDFPSDKYDGATVDDKGLIIGVPQNDWNGWRALSKLQFSDAEDYYSWRIVQAEHDYRRTLEDLESKREEAALAKTPEGKIKAEAKKLRRAMEKAAKKSGMSVKEFQSMLKSLA